MSMQKNKSILETAHFEAVLLQIFLSGEKLSCNIIEIFQILKIVSDSSLWVIFIEKFHDTDSHAFESISQLHVKWGVEGQKFLSSRSVAEKIQNLTSDFIGWWKSEFSWLDEIPVMEENVIEQLFFVQNHLGTLGAEEFAFHCGEFWVCDFQLEERDKSRFRNFSVPIRA